MAELDTGWTDEDLVDLEDLEQSAGAVGDPGTEPHRGARGRDSAAQRSDGRPIRVRGAQPSGAPEDSYERWLRHGRPPPKGWRRAVWQATAGWVRIPPPPGERRQAERTARIRTPTRGPHHIAVISRKGGIGKTTTTLGCGHALASVRGDRVLAVDGNPDAGTLAWRIDRDTDRTAVDVLADLDTTARYGDLRAYTSQAPSRLEVLAAPTDPAISQALGADAYRRLLEVFDVHHNIILVDCGTGILDDATRGILTSADQLLVVCPPAVDGARAAGATLDWLDNHGHHRLVVGAVLVINGVRRGTLVDLDRVEDEFADRVRDSVRIPWDRHLAAGEQMTLADLSRATREAYLDLAATVADGFTNRERRPT